MHPLGFRKAVFRSQSDLVVVWVLTVSPAIIFLSGPCARASPDGCNFRVARECSTASTLADQGKISSPGLFSRGKFARWGSFSNKPTR
jgi:hypothetical protein